MSSDVKDENSVSDQENNAASLNAAMQVEDKSVGSRRQCPFAAGGGRNPALASNMRQFHVLDEVERESSKESADEDESLGESFDEDDLSGGDVEKLLDNALSLSKKRKRTADESDKDKSFKEKEKIVLIDKGRNHFDVLPEGWIEVTHNSGMHVYLHKQGRVCTMSKPYFLGTGSARKHNIPLSAIPCLSYRKALEAENEATAESPEQPPSSNSGNIDDNANSIGLLNGDADKDISESPAATSTNSIKIEGNGSSMCLPKDDREKEISESPTADSTAPSTSAGMGQQKQKTLPSARIETIAENVLVNSLEPSEVTAYCQRLFQFDQISVMRFRNWSDRRQYSKRRKQEKQLQRPTLPDGTKLITFPIPSLDGGASVKNSKKEFIMNPNGKSYVCILHEYVQHALKKQPTYKYTELENAATPYAATVSINDMQYGMGYGTSKKQAKSDAAKATLEILIPEMRAKITADEKLGGASISKAQDDDLSFFDEIKIEDPRVAEFCAKTTEPSPHEILLTCLQRNFGLGDLKISHQCNTLKHQKNEFTMTVGKHTATVVCKNKRDGKQRASQAILQALHPHVLSWGSLLRLYGNRSVKSFKEKKLEEQEITQLQSKATPNKPNFAILNKLRTELLKLGKQREAIQPIGVFGVPDNEVLPNLSGSDLRNVDL